MKKSIEQEIQGYGSLLNSLSRDKLFSLKEAILNLQNFGVASYAERFIDKNGNSIKICNNHKWKMLEHEKGFFSDFSEHISNELLNSYKLKNRIITRSSDKVFNKFLQTLENEHLNNSIIVTEFYTDYVLVSYFMVKKECPINRDMILNNLNIIENSRRKIQKELLNLFLSGTFDQDKKPLLSKDSVNIIFDIANRKKQSLRINQNDLNLTQREVDCLKVLGTGVSNRLIAQHLKISTDTVKFHLNNIKLKTGILYRQDLMKLIPFISKNCNQANVIYD